MFQHFVQLLKAQECHIQPLFIQELNALTMRLRLVENERLLPESWKWSHQSLSRRHGKLKWIMTSCHQSLLLGEFMLLRTRTFLWPTGTYTHTHTQIQKCQSAHVFGLSEEPRVPGRTHQAHANCLHKDWRWNLIPNCGGARQKFYRDSKIFHRGNRGKEEIIFFITFLHAYTL